MLDSDWKIEPLTRDDIIWSREFLAIYADSRTSVMSIAERLGARPIDTLDRREVQS
jgi:hypothetical protein